MGFFIAPVDIFLQSRPRVIRAVSTCSGNQRFCMPYSQNVQCDLQISCMELYSLYTVVTEDGEPGYLSRYSDGELAGWRGLIPGRGKGFHPTSHRLDQISGSPCLLTSGKREFFPRPKSGRSLKLTTHLHLVPKSKG
jgi:hypothetical protein